MKLLLWLGRPIVLGYLGTTLLSGTVAWAILAGEHSAPSPAQVLDVLIFILSVGSILTPISLACVTAWFVTQLHARGQWTQLRISGASPHKIASKLGLILLGLLCAGTVLAESLRPVFYETIAPSMFRESRRHDPILLMHGTTPVAVQPTKHADQLQHAWRWEQEGLAQYTGLRFTNGSWRTALDEEVALPSPNRIVASRPYLYELLPLSDLWNLTGQLSWPTTFAGAVFAERVMRPVLWWLVLQCLVVLLLAGGLNLLTTGAVLFGCVLFGGALGVLVRDIPWRVDEAPLAIVVMLAPIGLAWLALWYLRRRLGAR